MVEVFKDTSLHSVWVCEELKALWFINPKCCSSSIKEMLYLPNMVKALERTKGPKLPEPLDKNYINKFTWYRLETRPDIRDYDFLRGSQINQPAIFPSTADEGVLSMIMIESAKVLETHDPKKFYGPFDGYYKFAFVRNPYERLFSSFKMFKITNRYKEVDNSCGFNDFVKLAFNEFSEDDHIRPQIDFIPNDSIHIDFIGKVENFNKDWKKLEKELSGPREDEHLIKLENNKKLSGPVKTINESIFVKDIISRQPIDYTQKLINKKIKPNQLPKFPTKDIMSKETSELIEYFYFEDFKNFKYEQEIYK